MISLSLSSTRASKYSFGLSALVLLFPVLLGGCLSDTGPIVEVRPRLVVAPQLPRFFATNYQAGAIPTGDMVVRWHRSVSDTQLNFKGYFLKRWTSIKDSGGGIDTALRTLMDSVRIPSPAGSIDTTWTFPHTPMGRYTVTLYGWNGRDTLSLDSSQFSMDFDPRPLDNPTNLRANSVAAIGSLTNSVRLTWNLPGTDTNIGFYRFVIYYRDTTVTNTKWQVIGAVPHSALGTPQINTFDASVSAPITHSQAGFPPYYPYQFWVKSERNDSTFFYGSDTNSISWAGAAYVTPSRKDSVQADSVLDYGVIHSSMYFGPLNQTYTVVDSTHDAQVKVSINGDQVTLSVQNTGVGFLDDGTGNARIDPAYSLDSMSYTAPVADPSRFTVKSVTLPTTSQSAGIVVYLMMTDDIQPKLGNQWARIFFKHQINGTFVTSDGAVAIKASFQPGVTKDGSRHLPFY